MTPYPVTYIIQSYEKEKNEDGDFAPVIDKEVKATTGLLLSDADTINYIRPLSKDKILVNVKRNVGLYFSEHGDPILKTITYSPPTTPTKEN